MLETSDPPARKQEQEQAPTAASPQPGPTQTPTPKLTHHVSHSRPLFPSVARLLQEYGVHDPEKIKGTGVRGMLTKGDVLAFLGKASSPTGTFKQAELKPGSGAPKAAEVKIEKVRPSLFFYHLRNQYSMMILAIGWTGDSSAYCTKYVSDSG